MMMRWAAVLLVAVALPAAAQTDDAPPHWWAQVWDKTDFTLHSVPFSEFLSGGVGRDGIPPIYEPEFVAAKDAATTDGLRDLGAQEPVIVLTINNEERAYPVRVLIWREIANDVIGGIPVAVTFCPLCNSAVAFDRRVRGKATRFGVSGMLRNSDLVMWDHQGEGWWQQFTGECLVGWCLGETLRLLPTRMEGWSDFLARAPNAKVLTPGTDTPRRWGANPYRGYDALTNKPFLYAGTLPEGIAAMARVVSLGARGAIALSVLRKIGEARLADGAVVSWKAGQRSALDKATIAQGRDIGSIVVRAANGDPVLHDVVFAFVQHAFYPDAPLITDANALSAL